VVVLFGIRILQQWILDKINPVGGTNVYVYDNDAPAPKLFGRSAGFNSRQGPVLVLSYTHLNEPGGTSVTTRALLSAENSFFDSASSIRHSYITSQQSVFYSGANCTGTAYVLDPTSAYAERNDLEAFDDDADPATVPVNVRQDYHRVSQFYGLQGFIYAIGRIDGIPGGDHNQLYRAPTRQTSINLGNAVVTPAGTGRQYDGPSAAADADKVTAAVVSVYVSERLGMGRCQTIPFKAAYTDPYWDFRPTRWSLVQATLIDDLDEAGDVFLPWSGPGANDLGSATPFTGYWVPVQAAGTIPANFTDPSPEDGGVEVPLNFNPPTGPEDQAP
jgi:hypothetical protein